MNEATATYSDGTNNFDAVSNQVTITVEEVRGLTVTDAGFTDDNGGSIATGDDLFFDFLVTNTGNADAYVFVPGTTALDGLATGGDITAVEIIEVDGAVLGTPISVPAAGDSTENLTGVGAIPADGNFKVRVTMNVTATNAGDSVKVQFGNTADNSISPADGSQDQQNIRDDSDGSSNIDDVRTLDADATQSPANGEREAAASSEQFLSTAPDELAQVTILLESTTDAGANDNDATDDTITYDLDFRVENNPQPGFPAGSLEGTNITLDGASEERILVSTTVPPDTEWNGSFPTAPTNWIPVYSTDDAYTGTENPIDGIDWITIDPSNLPTPSTVARIGFVYDAGANGALPPGTTVSGFDFTVVTSGLPTTGGTVANIAQIFGETEGDADDNLVYDESGDQDPNNYDDGVFPANPDISDFITNPQTGAADPNDPDPNGDNQGTGPDGESNISDISALPVTADALLNGPDGVPNATGPNNENDDFTNAAATVPAAQVGAQGDSSNPNSVVITNTVSNSVATNLDNVTLLPLAPDATAALTSGDHGDDRTNTGNGLDDEIPDNTTVTIEFGGQTATYTYNSTTGFTSSDSPVIVGTLTSGQQQDYTVTIDLPDGTGQILGYTIPILAFVDNNGSGDFDSASETVFNFTNNRVYPGFITLVKTARIIDRDGTTELEGFTPTPTVEPEPGQFVEYQISYQNISEVQPASGGGNVTLTGSNLTINEDGTASPNTWASITTHQQNTAATSGTLEFFDGATLLGTSDPASGSTVTRYENTIPSLAPQASGTFTFRRVVD